MNDTPSSPDEPDGRIATDRTEGVPGTGSPVPAGSDGADTPASGLPLATSDGGPNGHGNADAGNGTPDPHGTVREATNGGMSSAGPVGGPRVGGFEGPAGTATGPAGGAAQSGQESDGAHEPIGSTAPPASGRGWSALGALRGRAWSGESATAPATPPAGVAPSTATPPAAGAGRTGPGGPTADVGGAAADPPGDATRPGTEPARPLGDDATAEFRVPPANGHSHEPAAGAEPRRMVVDPEPSGVPGPGPDAAGPPPWHRVPGQDPVAASVGSVPRQRPAGGLLDPDGPTAFLDVPGVPADEELPPAGGPEDGRGSGPSAARSMRGRPPRQAALQLKRLDPWSVLKLALVLALVLFLIWLVAIGVLYGVLDGIGVWDRLNGTYADLVSGSTSGGSPLISAGRVFGVAAVVGAINSVLFAVAVTLAAFVYNVSADLVGGIEVTLSERD